MNNHSSQSPTFRANAIAYICSMVNRSTVYKFINDSPIFIQFETTDETVLYIAQHVNAMSSGIGVAV